MIGQYIADIAVIQSPLPAPRNRSFVHHVAVERKDLAWDEAVVPHQELNGSFQLTPTFLS